MKVTWSGQHRAPIDDRGVYPRPLQTPLPVWIAVGGTPEIGVAGRDARAADGARDHRRIDAAVRADRQLLPGGGATKRTRSRALPVSINSHGFVAETSQEAFETAWTYSEPAMRRIGQERGWSGRSREQLQAEMTLPGALRRRQPGAGDRKDSLPA